MIVIVDASVLVAELLRERGRALLARSDLRCLVAEEQWEETAHELGKRLRLIVTQGLLSEERAGELFRDIKSLVETRVIEVIPRSFYAHMETTARRRVPRDPKDWAPVALALVLDAAILTGDGDFLGCGCPTWTVETLLEELNNSSS